jgi:general secretion pathway protein C
VPAQWLSNSSAMSGRAGAALSGALNAISQPANALRLRQGLLCLLGLWGVLALTRLLWALVPGAESTAAAPPEVINPVSVSAAGAAGAGVTAAPVDIERVVGWHLFGEVGATAPVAAAPEQVAKTEALAGIEDGARKTQLQIKLTGIVASTGDGLGHAIIESQNQQAVYAVGDKLPVAGQVKLAKVMPQQVVLDNGGTYELLVLFEKSSLGSLTPAAPEARAAPPAAAEQLDKRSDAETTSLAQSYRERLYQNPQSLAEVVSVSAVREGAMLLGYRVNPGKDKAQFEQLGFKAGDMVTSVNGITLDNPANTMAIYNSLRDAGEAVFQLQRDNQQVGLSVNLDSGAIE